MNLKALILLLLLGLAWAQEEAAEEAGEAGENEVEDGAEEGEDCEEAWEYLEFLKSEVKEKVEVILQETLFEPRNLLEDTVAKAMSQTLEIRDAILQRTKDIRTGEGDITICPDQGVNQEQFLSMIRMDVMTVLLSLIEQDAATPDKLKVHKTEARSFIRLRIVFTGNWQATPLSPHQSQWRNHSHHYVTRDRYCYSNIRR